MMRVHPEASLLSNRSFTEKDKTRKEFLRRKKANTNILNFTNETSKPDEKILYITKMMSLTAV